MKDQKRHNKFMKCSVNSILAATIGLAVTAAKADDLDSHIQFTTISKTTIAEDALSGLAGISAINISAGDSNLQQNSTAIAVSSNSSFSASTVKPSQINQFNSSVQNIGSNQTLIGEILPGAFNDGVGIVMVNQSSGSGNSQLNGAAIAIGAPGSFAAIELGDLELASQVSAVDSLQSKLTDSPDGPEMTAVLADDAFRNSQGIVQINQVVGNGNRTVNALSMSVQIQSQ
jgi:hypothetical protein